MRWKHTLEAVHARPRGAPPSARERRCPVEEAAPERSCPVGVRLGGLTAGVEAGGRIFTGTGGVFLEKGEDFQGTV